MNPRICPPPPDCPLYKQRLPYADDEPLRRAVLAELHRSRSSLPALIHAEAAEAAQPRHEPRQLPAPALQFPPVARSEKGVKS